MKGTFSRFERLVSPDGTPCVQKNLQLGNVDGNVMCLHTGYIESHLIFSTILWLLWSTQISIQCARTNSCASAVDPHTILLYPWWPKITKISILEMSSLPVMVSASAIGPSLGHQPGMDAKAPSERIFSVLRKRCGNQGGEGKKLKLVQCQT